MIFSHTVLFGVYFNDLREKSLSDKYAHVVLGKNALALSGDSIRGYNLRELSK